MLRLGLILLVVPAVLLMAGYMFDLSLADACLDQGGSWNYLTTECDDAGKDHPFVPFMVRHPLWVNGGMLLSVVGLLICMAGLYRRR
ncbi:hypothetical protein [Marinobacterium sediminicola]|uniref:Transmembrane protein n=1 Tax=Marinobacterium sediminicola TaxID=518898 RepID=A0ABY1RZ31_9GAMM|nr:hypothetical protein [Marinobacterium sediminicola]ULG69133.1 hypothetical protein LN244_15865 [Marinobacterium sediminicola]SMR73586.1 hypothetical protein SAMN04487964_10562 [Marinobacterium sediminicola]